MDRQAVYYASLLKKMANNEPIHIVCQGDSMTYGHDTTSSDIRPKQSDPTCEPEGMYPDHEQAGKTYPEALQEFCDIMFGQGKTKITNRGFSGDWAEMSRKRWSTNPHADLHLIMLGTNDASSPYVPLDAQQNITKYMEDMGQLIEQIHDFQSAIVLLTPPKHSNENDLIRASFRQSLKVLGARYHIPVIDTTQFLKDYPFLSVQSDEVHYNTKGHTIFAAKIAGILAGLSNVYHPFRIGANQLIAPSFHDYGIAFKRNDSLTVALEEDPIAPIGVGSSDSKGLMFHLFSNTGMTFSFLAEHDHLIVTPLFDITDSNGGLEIMVDFGIDLGSYTSPYIFGGYRRDMIPANLGKSQFTYAGQLSRVDLNAEDASITLDHSFHLPRKGFYSITLGNPSASHGVYVYGFLIRSYESFIPKR